MFRATATALVAFAVTFAAVGDLVAQSVLMQLGLTEAAARNFLLDEIKSPASGRRSAIVIAGTRAFLKSIGSDPISPLFEKALTNSVAPAMANTTEALAAFVRWDLFRNSMLRFMENYDAVLSAVAPFPALLHGTSFEEENRRGFGYAQAYNLTGWPTATVRVGTSPEGLPLGVQVAARPWREDVALALVQHLEHTFGGWKMPTAI